MRCTPIRLAVAALLAWSSAPALAARPLQTDDAGVIARGSCELEGSATRLSAADGRTHRNRPAGRLWRGLGQPARRGHRLVAQPGCARLQPLGQRQDGALGARRWPVRRRCLGARLDASNRQGTRQLMASCRHQREAPREPAPDGRLHRACQPGARTRRDRKTTVDPMGRGAGTCRLGRRAPLGADGRVVRRRPRTALVERRPALHGGAGPARSSTSPLAASSAQTGQAC